MMTITSFSQDMIAYHMSGSLFRFTLDLCSGLEHLYRPSPFLFRACIDSDLNLSNMTIIYTVICLILCMPTFP